MQRFRDSVCQSSILAFYELFVGYMVVTAINYFLSLYHHVNCLTISTKVPGVISRAWVGRFVKQKVCTKRPRLEIELSSDFFVSFFLPTFGVKLTAG